MRKRGVHNRLLFVFFVTMIAGVLAAGALRAAAGDDKAIKLTGCLVRGEGDGAGFMLINSPFEPAFDSAKASHIEPNAVGTSGNYGDTFYWLDGDRGLGKNVGHEVEVVGYLRNIKNGDLTVDRKDNWTEMTVKSDGRTMKARVPNSSIVGSGHDDHKADVIVKRLDVDHVKMTAAGCR